MTLPANSSSRSSPQKTGGMPKESDVVLSYGASSSASLNTTVRVSERLKVPKKVFDPSYNNVAGKRRRRGRPVGSLYKSSIMNRLIKSGHDMSDPEGAPLSESQVAQDASMEASQSGSGISKSRSDNNSQGQKYKAQSTLPIDPFLKPHELDRASSKLADDVSMDPSIPDITNWTTDDVFKYFTKYLPEAASILKEQEYDGKALRTARRADIVRGLGLPLGPALALYRIIVKLQTRKDDWTMCWG